MNKILTVLILLCMTIPMFAIAETTTVAVMYTDTVDDKGWCQSMDTGIKNAIAKGYDIDYTPVEHVAIPDAPNMLEQLADNYDIIIAHGAYYASACQEISEEYPDQIFVVGTSDKIMGDNIYSYMPQSEEPGYINGIIAGLATKNGKIGIVGSTDGGDSARYVRGFILGLRETNPEAAENYLLSWTGSYSDTVGAGDIAKTFLESGCDMLVGPAQQAVGALRIIASENKALWVAQTSSQLVDFPNVVLAAADYDYSAVIISVMDRLAEGVTGGECIPLCYNNGGFAYTFSEDTSLLLPEIRTAAEAAYNKLLSERNLVDYTSVELK